MGRSQGRVGGGWPPASVWGEQGGTVRIGMPFPDMLRKLILSKLGQVVATNISKEPNVQPAHLPTRAILLGGC